MVTITLAHSPFELYAFMNCIFYSTITEWHTTSTSLNIGKCELKIQQSSLSSNSEGVSHVLDGCSILLGIGLHKLIFSIL